MSWGWGALNGARTENGARIGLLLLYQLYRLLHLRHPLHHLDLKVLIVVDACNQLLSSLSILDSLLSILDSLLLHLHQSSLIRRMDVRPRCA